MKKKIEELPKNTLNRLKKYLNRIWEIIREPEMSVLPGQLAFFILLSLVPIITLAGILAGFFSIDGTSLVELLNQVIPGDATILLNHFDLSLEKISIYYILLFVWMFYLASSGCNTVILISNEIYGIKQSNWFKRRIKAIFMTLSIVILIIFLLIVPIFGTKLASFFSYLAVGDTLEAILKYVRSPFIFLIMYIFLRVFYNFAPDRVRSNSHLNIGALFTAIGWFIVTSIYSFLSQNMTTYNILYGALSNIAILMIWLYFVSYFFVIGLALNHSDEIDEDLEKTRELMLELNVSDEEVKKENKKSKKTTKKKTGKS